MNYPTPKLLQPGVAKALNCKAYNVAGCFFFLSTEALPSQHSIEAQGSFLGLVLALYCLYCNYGRNFWKVCLKKGLVPSGQRNVAEFEMRRRQAEEHVGKVRRILRPGFCHGTFPYDDARDKLPKELERYCQSRLTDKNTNWNDTVSDFKTFTRKNWLAAYKLLAQESDELYKYLHTWIDSWDNESDSEKEQLMRLFFADSQRSFNVALTEPIMKIESGGYQVGYDIKKQILKNMLTIWQGDIQNKFLSYSYRSPEEIYRDLASLIRAKFTPSKSSSLQKAKGTEFDVT